ncbi:TetR/AcrR family transcriptional regulator [Paenibacillus sp. SI8]|uniref:TetR/AcrR family transcriptional regulator n=1 Tax=unclassified Paenibacillus TaxID=185978 RepID=UPI0034677E78
MIVDKKKSMDRRARRSLGLIKKSFFELMMEKRFTAITIEDIAMRADVNRSTFYSHFEDKYDLLDTAIREQFLQLLAEHLPDGSVWHASNLHILIRAVLDQFTNLNRQCYESHVIHPLFERAVQEETFKLLMRWFDALPTNMEWSVPKKTLASTISWTIFGTAVMWSKEKTPLSTDQMAEQIYTVITGGTAALIPLNRV